ncbi:MAG: hypothetical protein RLY31_1872 [Bacteroidota bacterium]|jgi:guanylate kinase
MPKLVVLTAPSGAGKTTIVHALLQARRDLSFSVSATTRSRRPTESDGVDYHFLSKEEFRSLIDQDAFLEWEEVYQDQFYGTLHREVQACWNAGRHVIFDIDVKGAQRIKQAYPDKTLTVFVKPPSLEVLRERLQKRESETPESIRKRLEKASFELSFENFFDIVLVNDNLEATLREATDIVNRWLDDQQMSPPA